MLILFLEQARDRPISSLRAT